jgi:hypothetical protein
MSTPILHELMVRSEVVMLQLAARICCPTMNCVSEAQFLASGQRDPTSLFEPTQSRSTVLLMTVTSGYGEDVSGWRNKRLGWLSFRRAKKKHRHHRPPLIFIGWIVGEGL